MEILNNEPEQEQEETEILTLTDENGNDVDFEYLDCLEYQDKEYLVLMPTDEAETQITWPWRMKPSWMLCTGCSRTSTRTF